MEQTGGRDRSPGGVEVESFVAIEETSADYSSREGPSNRRTEPHRSVSEVTQDAKL